ncbi:MAG: glycosyltransferase [Acidobacteriota bacterium]
MDTAIREEQPGPVSGADLVVGIPSYCEADSIGRVIRQVGHGLRDYYGHLSSVIVNVDNASPDDTKSAFFAADSSGVPRIYLSTPAGLTGKGRNFRNLFSLVQELEPRAVAVVDADLISITPEWVPRLLEPVLSGLDYVAPLYVRHPHDGTITNHICYPLLYGLCGLQLRQPIGGDFAFAPWLAQRWLKVPWRQSTCEYGIDITMTMHAVFGGARLAQAPLGAKIHKPSAPKLGRMFVQVIDSLFGMLNENRSQWLNNGHLGIVEEVGQRTVAEPQEMTLDHEAMETDALAEYAALQQELAAVLSGGTLARVTKAFSGGAERLDGGLWLRCVYDSLGAYSHGRMETAVAALKPLYLGRVVAFVRETIAQSHSLAEAAILAQAANFREERDYAVGLVASPPPCF